MIKNKNIFCKDIIIYYLQIAYVRSLNNSIWIYYFLLKLLLNNILIKLIYIFKINLIYLNVKLYLKLFGLKIKTLEYFLELYIIYNSSKIKNIFNLSIPIY